MRCPNCGEQNLQGADLCDVCGSDLAGLDLPEAGSGFRGRLLSGRVDQLPMAPAVRVAADATVEEAIRGMRQARHGCVLVEEDGDLTGIFTERDVLVRVVRRGLDPAAVAVGEVMSSDPLTLDPTDPPAYAIHRMVTQSLRHIPVVESGWLRGFVSVRSVLRFLEEEFAEPSRRH